MIYHSLRDFRYSTKAAFDIAAAFPVYIERSGTIYLLKVLGPADLYKVAVTNNGDQIFIKKGASNGSAASNNQ